MAGFQFQASFCPLRHRVDCEVGIAPAVSAPNRLSKKSPSGGTTGTRYRNHFETCKLVVGITTILFTLSQGNNTRG